jgi:hypothetical protein
MLPHTIAVRKKLATLSHVSENRDENTVVTNSDNSELKYSKLKEHRDTYFSAPTQIYDETDRSENNSRLSANIYDTDKYIHTLENKIKYVYPFIDELSKVIPANTFTPNKKYTINVCVYRIFNNGISNPFLQFKMLKRKTSKEMTFPSFVYETNERGSSQTEIDKLCLIRGNDAITRWFKVHAHNIKFKGFIKTRNVKSDTTDDDATSCYLIYEELITNDRYKTILQTELRNIKSTENWWWACTYEIFNKGMVLTYPVCSIVRELFRTTPVIMFLYDNNGFTYETPTVLYTGFTEGSSLEEIRLLGPRKSTDDNNITNQNIGHRNVNENRMYGTQYYFYDLDDVFRYACYAYDNSKHKYKKISDPYIFRYVVFLGTTKVTMFDTDNTTTHVSINGVNTFHDTKWTTMGYESIFHGRYKIKGYYLGTVFSVFDNTQFTGLSCHEIDVATVPSEFSDIVFKTINIL